jgi:hypothetical protein
VARPGRVEFANSVDRGDRNMAKKTAKKGKKKAKKKSKKK